MSFHFWNPGSSFSNTWLPTVTPIQPQKANQIVKTTDTQKTILNGNMFLPLSVFQNNEITNTITKTVQNIRDIK